MHITGQMRGQHVLAQREIVAVLVPDVVASPAAHRWQLTRFASTRVLPLRGVDVSTRGEQSREEVDHDFRADRRSTGPGCISKKPVCTGPGGAACFGVTSSICNDRAFSVRNCVVRARSCVSSSTSPVALSG